MSTEETGLTIKQAAEQYGFPVETIHAMIKTGRLVGYEQEGEVLLSKDDFDKNDIISCEEAAKLGRLSPGFEEVISAHKRLVGLIAEKQSEE